jgi:hypothetical protein
MPQELRVRREDFGGPWLKVTMKRLACAVITGALALNFGASLHAASSFTEDDVRQWLAMWQKRDALQDRTITVRFVHYAEFRKDADADVRWSLSEVNIEFVEPSEWGVYGMSPPATREWGQKACIHELMHVVLSALYDYTGGPSWLDNDRAANARLEAITERLAWMLKRRHPPDGVSVAQYVARQIDNGPWHPAADVRERVMLQIVRAMNAANEDDILLLANR